jgi:PAS domain S-box-containing protein
MPDKPLYEEMKSRVEELEQAKNELLKRVDRYKLAIEAIEGGLWDFDPRTGIAYLSPRWLTMLGYSPGELSSTYETWANLLHPDDRSRAEDAVKGFLEHPEGSLALEFRMRAKNGDWRWIHSQGKAFERDSEGNVSRMIGMQIDITERQQLEESLRLTKFSFDKASVGIYWIASDARILNVNEQAAKSLGYSTEELTSMTIFDIDPLVNNDNWGAIWQNLLKQGGDQFETIHIHKDRREIPIYVTSNLLEYNGLQFSIAFAQDITERKRMEEALLQSQKMEAIGTLAGGIAHDFNNILGAILGYAQLAQHNSSEKQKVQEYIDNIYLAGERAKGLVQQILAFSRQSKTEKIPVDIGLVIKEALKLLRASSPSTIEMCQNVKSNLGTVLADQTQIHQIVMNLCMNAFHAMEKEGGQLDIDLTPVEINTDDSKVYEDIIPGRYLKLTVADTGHGMDAKTISNIFEPYFTTKETGEGTGLGLAMVHGIVKNHGGNIKAYSEPGIGTSFHVLFPLIENGKEKKEEALHPLSKGNENILFIDDEEFLIDIGKGLLESLGYKVETRTSPYDALEAFRAQADKYDMVITDMTMPKMTGEKLASEIKKIRPDIPIILCTGYSSRITPINVAKMGISDILMKPLTLHTLANTVRKVLDEKPI